jgi:hypothetical protein
MVGTLLCNFKLYRRASRILSGAVGATAGRTDAYVLVISGINLAKVGHAI